MDVHAHLRFLRMSPRKVRLVIDVIRGKSVPIAVTNLEFLRKDAARPVLKLLQSAMANAEHNFKLDPTMLRVKSVMADGGPTLKRWRPRAFGRAAPIRKRTTHISLVLSDDKAAPVGKKKERILAAKSHKAPRTKHVLSKSKVEGH
ncbi:50S ribosomal protein L22 [Candidatus Uhrbacteria bacterium RIFCSPHIGHO2_12_FULL_60_25]|uniref:Large ribosomal subunit protein uL22 n=1 Tax=Candidatus Uhrbacteria bacterium RIFCSPHIGHO2_12_FULL_60_25 TaxID=1802399 RepID=A0A1F7ULR5_9BACT|nr:MAG: 50S ribosomal protein L22 [Candidatus Uhrbacteria bacterium RIFCSPHIGHO2_02_FULL_60_44]OGL79223.1 MAG: 50S ribosomal protein L22 [Candidatus Uhrbacteria bacterium RIFCSPHIGHO2_12_FULL_60_25]